MSTPEEMTSDLTVEQTQRIVALREARKVLETKGAGAGAFSSGSSEPPLVWDLLSVAHYVVSGEVIEWRLGETA